jgi:hypothetical protein
MYLYLMSEYNYEYEDARYIDHTDADISKDDVFELLFRGTVSGTPAINYELNAINSQSSSRTEELIVREVSVREDSDQQLVFEVRSPSITITAPAGQPDHDVRVLHNDSIPYNNYQVALLN